MFALCVAVAVAGGAVADASSAGGGYPGLYYAGMTKKPDAPPKKRFALFLFTKYAQPGAGDEVSAQKGRAEAFAHSQGHNKGYEEWRIARKSHKGAKVTRRIRKGLQRHGHVRFFGYVYPHNATDPFRFVCRLTHFNDPVGNCRSIITPV